MEGQGSAARTAGLWRHGGEKVDGEGMVVATTVVEDGGGIGISREGGWEVEPVQPSKLATPVKSVGTGTGVVMAEGVNM